MTKRRVLLQFDPDPLPSSFDSVVAIDAGVDVLLPYSGVTPGAVREIVHGAMFTRGADDLKSTAIFIGGKNVAQGEALLAEISKAFFGPLRVSVLLDSNGANTTAAAAVVGVMKHVALPQVTALVLGATGPVGQRVARLLALQGAALRVGSRDAARAESVADKVRSAVSDARVTAVHASSESQVRAALASCQVLVAAGSAGASLVSEKAWHDSEDLQVVIDLNAVPPVGVEGVEPLDRDTQRHGKLCSGALGVGGIKMKIHKAAIARLFERNDQVLDAVEVLALGQKLLLM